MSAIPAVFLARVALSVLTLLTIDGCTGSGGVKSRSENYNSRVRIIVIHHTTANFADSLQILTQPSANPVSSHYLIPEPEDQTYTKSKLKVYELVPESARAWHAGSSHWSGKTGLNDQSIGIELVNQTYCHSLPATTDMDSADPERICFYPDFAESQISLLIGLLEGIYQRHPDIRPTHIVGHADIAPGRKIDPGPRFPWQRLHQLGYGAWPDDDTVLEYWERFKQSPLRLPEIQQGLLAYGYGIELTGEPDQQTQEVIRAFQMHFRPSEVSGEVTTETAAVLFALLDKYHPDRAQAILSVCRNGFGCDGRRQNA